MITPTYLGTDITLTTSYLDNTANIDALDLTATINCCTTEYTAVLDVLDVVNGAIVVDGADLFGVTTLEDGIYSFTLKITYNDDTVRNERGCMFVDLETACKVAEYVAETQSLDVLFNYNLLTKAPLCGCECTNFCTILEHLWKTIGLIDCDLCDTSVNCSSC